MCSCPLRLHVYKERHLLCAVGAWLLKDKEHLSVQVFFPAPYYSGQNMLDVWYMFDKGMNNWKYDLEQMLALSYISTSFGILFLLPHVEGENVRARRDPPNLSMVRMRKCSQRGECLSPVIFLLVALWRPSLCCVLPTVFSNSSFSVSCSCTYPHPFFLSGKFPFPHLLSQLCTLNAPNSCLMLYTVLLECKQKIPPRFWAYTL